jgi:site-specific recombinase XerD
LGGCTIQGRANPHAYRHAWARDALNAGADITKVARTLGNSLRVTAEYYALWSDHEIQAAHAKYSPGASLPLIKPTTE